MNLKRIELVMLGTVLIAFALGIYFYPQMPEQIASHWNARGEVDGYMGKFWGIFLAPFILLGMALLFNLIPRIDPLQANYQRFRTYYDGFFLLCLSERNQRSRHMIRLSLPTTDPAIARLKVGDQVLLNGTMITGRDAAHHYMIENFIKHEPPESERRLYETLKKILAGNVIYRCGPVVAEENGKYKFVASDPTTSIRKHFEVMTLLKKTLKSCRKL